MISIGKGIPAIEERRKPRTPPMLAIAVKAGPPKDDMPPKAPMADDAGMPDNPAEEGSEDYTAKLLEDITTAGASRGLSPEDSKAFAGDLMDAIAKCLRGESEPGAGAMPPMPAGAGDEPAA